MSTRPLTIALRKISAPACLQAIYLTLSKGRAVLNLASLHQVFQTMAYLFSAVLDIHVGRGSWQVLLDVAQSVPIVVGHQHVRVTSKLLVEEVPYVPAVPGRHSF